ncbi:MAG: hypothetical protein ACYS0G_02575 [Planctomycetota bacterium]|jgi:hypothetical protein
MSTKFASGLSRLGCRLAAAAVVLLLAVSARGNPPPTYIATSGKDNWSKPGAAMVAMDTRPTSVAARDVDGDLVLDLAVVNKYGRSVSILRSNDEVEVDLCPGDLTNDGFVGINDLLILLAAWGPNPGHPADIDNDGTVGINDLLALLSNWGLCPVAPGCGGDSGSCCVANGTPGCADTACCTIVCDSDPYCCDVDWDGVCAEQAQALCDCSGGFCGPGNGNCCVANGTPGCEDTECCESICTADPFCCDQEWDAMCAAQAQAACDCSGGVCGPGNGTCCVANGTPGCEDIDCCNAVCAADPWCCDVEWDGQCAEAAQALCDCP